MSPDSNDQQTHIFETEIWLPRPLSEVFEFFKHAENLQLLTPAWLRFKILTPQPISLKEGTLIDYSLSLYGIPLRWQTKISQWQPPAQFQDVQLRGPYRRWEHTHTFEEKNGGTLMRDQVKYEVPGGTLAPLMNKLFVSKQISRIFEYRKKKILERFG